MKNYHIPSDGFNIGSLHLTFYGIIVAFAMLIGVCLAYNLAKKRGIKSDDIITLALICFPLAIVGARLYYCIFHNDSLSEFFNIKNGISGLAVLGGVIGGVVGVLIFCAIKKNFRILVDLFDICVPALILGQAIGRIGCFFSQCCYGKLVTDENQQWFPFAMKVESYVGSGEYSWHLATNLYESVWNMLGFALLLTLFLRTKSVGLPTASYLVWYGFGRAFIEGLRGDSLFVGGTGIRVSQLLSVGLVLLGSAILIYIFVKHKKRSKNGEKV